MTRVAQKNHERQFAAAAARLMDRSWFLIARREHGGGPDFLVEDGRSGFGLEVVELFAGRLTERGSIEKKRQSRTHKLIESIRAQYERIHPDIRLYVKFLGPLTESDTASILDTLTAMQPVCTPFPHTEERLIRRATGDLKLFVRRLPDDWPRDRLHRPDWFSVSDTVGFVLEDIDRVREAIRKKSERLPLYRRNIARELKLTDSKNADVRLLIVADRMWNHGRIRLPVDPCIDPCGFKCRVFLSVSRTACPTRPRMPIRCLSCSRPATVQGLTRASTRSSWRTTHSNSGASPRIMSRIAA